jgi:hypothetical protein
LWLNWFKNRDLLTISFQRYSTVSNWKPLETQTSSFLPPISEKKKGQKKVSIIKNKRIPDKKNHKKKGTKKITKKRGQKERHEHIMSTNKHFQKTLVLRNSNQFSF